MSEKLSTQAAPLSQPVTSAHLGLDRAAGARLLARSFYRELRESGYTPKQLLSLSTELIELITEDLARDRAQPKGTA